MIIYREKRFLLFEETDRGLLIINQRAGRVESGVNLLSAVVRETEEETDRRVELRHLTGIFQHTSAATRVTYRRLALVSRPFEHLKLSVNADIVAVHWPDKLEIMSGSQRSPMAMACAKAYELPLDRHLILSISFNSAMLKSKVRIRRSLA
ncbi:MAG TPA: hypothetical protein DEQ32_08410 [Gammaproteobacteria bacterium]|nr:hypothetical protein [Gammaproteobacteria bacterium]